MKLTQEVVTPWFYETAEVVRGYAISLGQTIKIGNHSSCLPGEYVVGCISTICDRIEDGQAYWKIEYNLEAKYQGSEVKK